MKRATTTAIVILLAAAGSAGAASPVKTVGQFAHLSHAARVKFAIAYTTTHRVDPCTNATTPLPHAKAVNLAPAVAQLTPGRDPADGSYISPRTLVGAGIRHILANIGC